MWAGREDKEGQGRFREVENGHWSMIDMAFTGMSENLVFRLRSVSGGVRESLKEMSMLWTQQSLSSASRPGARALGSPL